MHSLRLAILVFAIPLIVACGSTAPSKPSPKFIRQSTRHLNLASTLFIKGCYLKALAHYQQAHERYTAADQTKGIAHSLNGIANVYYRLKEFPSAVAAYNEALESYESIQASPEMVRAMCNKAASLISAGKLEEAEAVLIQADQLGAKDNIKPALRQKSRALLLMQRNALQPAKALLQKAITSANRGEPEQLPSTNYTMGRLLMAQQLPTQAIDFLQRSLSLDRTAGAYEDIANDLAALGECYAQLMQRPQAAAHMKRSIKIFALLGNAAKVEALKNQLEANALATDQDAQATLHWVAQWLAGQKEANLCR